MADYDYTDVEAFFRDFQTEPKTQAVPETKTGPGSAAGGTKVDYASKYGLKQAKPAAKKAPSVMKKKRAARSSYSEKPESAKRVPLLPAILGLVSLLLVLWLSVNVHPASATAVSQAVKEEQSTNLVSGFNNFLVNTFNSSLSGLSNIRMVYTIPEDALVAPKPDQSLFGETTDPYEVQAVVDSAAELLNGQTLSWTPETELMPGTAIKYYCDETILAIAWKEAINGSAVTFAEIKTADGSQLRRALAENTYGSGVQFYATDMAQAANAVIAINGDFYTYRSQGITVYQRKMYRHSPKKIDTAFFTASGDMIFSRAGELENEDDARRFIIDNDIIFSAAFGPILVEDGQLQKTDSYPLGEVNSIYSRSAIGQIDSLHYLLMVIGQEGDYGKRALVNTAAEYIYNKGVKNAYALDGGQTAVMVMNGRTVNRVDWDAERTMSDIIYFATAVPDGEG